MRDFLSPGRSEAMGDCGMVATSHPLATLAGIETLKAGGSAVDAAVAAAALLAVVEPSQTGIGGDCFVMMKREGQPVIGINGSGGAAASASAAFYENLGIEVIASESAHAVTVPGAVRTWAMLAEDHGTFEWGRLLGPAIDAAENGFRVTERLARDWALQLPKLERACARGFLPGGSTPATGDRFWQPALAGTLRSLASSGADCFYEGWIAEDIVAALQRLGGPHHLDDFAGFRPRYETPIAVKYRDFQLWECAPNAQGLTALTMAALLERQDIASYAPLSLERLHLQAEIARIAYAERDAYLCDADDSDVTVKRLLSDAHLSSLSASISTSARLQGLATPQLREHRDTTYITVVDRDRTVVSFINSIFDDFGSGIVAPASGVLLHNRACGFVLEPGHPNVIAGRKRPMHTIIPAILTRQSEAVMSFGVTGGHFQPMGQMELLANVVDYGMSMQQAIDHPRWFARGEIFEVEPTMPEQLLVKLRELGHRPVRALHPLGTAQAIWIDRSRGLLRGGADGRRDGIALGF